MLRTKSKASVPAGSDGRPIRLRSGVGNSVAVAVGTAVLVGSGAADAVMDENGVSVVTVPFSTRFTARFTICILQPLNRDAHRMTKTIFFRIFSQTNPCTD
jgi:hypothetical protein